MKKNKNKKLILLTIPIILVMIFYSQIFQKENLYDDFLFFKILSKSNVSKKQKIVQKNEENTNIIKVEYKNTKLKNINLVNTINKKTLINEKIAPGVSGKFTILIYSNSNIKYRVKFEDENKKPKNIKFWIKNGEKQSNLSELEEVLKGEIYANEEKEIEINWEWKYQNNQKENKQDTYDGENIKKYNFNIYVIGEGGE